MYSGGAGGLTRQPAGRGLVVEGGVAFFKTRYYTIRRRSG